MKFAYRSREFWCRGCYVDTTGKNTEVIKRYIVNQLKEDQENDQLNMYDQIDPFIGGKLDCVCDRNYTREALLVI